MIEQAKVDGIVAEWKVCVCVCVSCARVRVCVLPWPCMNATSVSDNSLCSGYAPAI